jgi:thiol-disulfide isomerase/thioredoxin
MVKEITSEAEWRAAITSKTCPRVVIDCYGSECGPCQAIAPKMDSLAEKEQRVAFYKCQADSDNKALNALLGPRRGKGYNITAMPTFYSFVEGNGSPS